MFIQYIQCFNFAIFFSQFRASLLWNFSRKFARLVLKHCIGLLPLFFFFSKIAYSDQKFCDWDLKLLQATQHQGTGRGCLETLISTRWCCCDHCYTYAIPSKCFTKELYYKSIWRKKCMTVNFSFFLRNFTATIFFTKFPSNQLFNKARAREFTLNWFDEKKIACLFFVFPYCEHAAVIWLKVEILLFPHRVVCIFSFFEISKTCKGNSWSWL